MKVSSYLQEEKKTCKNMEKRILKDIATAMPHGKKFYIEIEDIQAKHGEPHVVTKVLWREKRSGADPEGHVSGPPAFSIILALEKLRDKAHEMARTQK